MFLFLVFFLKHFQVINCLWESTIKSCHGFILFYSTKAFLTPNQVWEIFVNISFSSDLNSEYHSKLRQLSSKFLTTLRKSVNRVPNFIANYTVRPSLPYFDPLIFTHFDVDLDMSLENSASSNLLELMSKQTKISSIRSLYKNSRRVCFLDCKYHVKLP